MAMTPQEQREFVALNMDADMQFIVSEAGVLLEHQVAIARYYGSLRKFGAIADDRAGVIGQLAYMTLQFHKILL